MWKDVDGVLTCDPNIYRHAAPVPYLTFDEAAELAYFGAQVSLNLLKIVFYCLHYNLLFLVALPNFGKRILVFRGLLWFWLKIQWISFLDIKFILYYFQTDPEENFNNVFR